LAAGFFEGGGAIDFFCGVAEFFFGGELGGDALTGFLLAQAAGAEALELLIGAAPGDDEAVEIFVVTRFHEQGGFDEGGGSSAVTGPFVELAVCGCFYARVKDDVEAGELCVVVENDCGQLCAIDAIVWIEDGGAEFAEDFVVGRLAGLDEFVREGIGVENVEAEFAQHGGDRGFAGGDAACEAEAEHLHFVIARRRWIARFQLSTRTWRGGGARPSRCCS
jgi:hypothetical protein